MRLKILTYPNENLTTPSEEVDLDKFTIEELEDYRKRLQEAMDEEEGLGLASPQVGRMLRIFVIQINPGEDENAVMFINPVMSVPEGSRKVIVNEGCLSLPGIGYNVPRWNSVDLGWYSPDGSYHLQRFNGLIAQAIQHEIDHLDGKLFIDRLSRKERRFLLKKYRKAN